MKRLLRSKKIQHRPRHWFRAWFWLSVLAGLFVVFKLMRDSVLKANRARFNRPACSAPTDYVEFETDYTLA